MRGLSVKTWILADTVLALGVLRFAPEKLILGSFFLTFAAIFIASIAIKVTYHSQIWPKFLSPLRSLPEVPNPTFWHGQFFLIRREDTGAPQRRWANTIPNKGLLRYTGFFNTERIFLTSPEALREVLVTKSYEFVKPATSRAILGRLLGFGVLLTEGDEHKFQRKHLMPAFAYRHVKDLVPTFWTKSTEMIRAIDKENSKALASDDGAVVSISNWASRCTLDIIGLAGMGFDFGAIQDPSTELNATYRRVFSSSRQAQLLEVLTILLPIRLVRMLPLTRNQETAEAANVIRRISRDVILEKKRRTEMQKEKGLEVMHKDIVSVALESEAFTDDNLVDQIMTFLAAGHETTSTATTWAMVALAAHPHVQAKLREEIRESLPSPDEDQATITAEQIDSLPYLHAVCNEVLRFHAPVPMTQRTTNHDTTILGQPVPKGTLIIISPTAINFNKDLWGDDVDEFKPERWLGKNVNSGGAASNFAMMTFLHGPRSCIGQKFAQVEFACLLASIVGRYEFELEPKDRVVEIQSGITIRPKGGLEVRLKSTPGW